MSLAKLILLLSLQLFLGGNCEAHGFGQRYDLPLPLWLYLIGAALTVALSFAFLVRRKQDVRSSPHIHSGGLIQFRPPGTGLFLFLLRLMVLVLYLLVIAAAYLGVQNPVKNIAPAMIWAVWWVGMAYLSALVGNVWELVNPLDSMFRCFEWLWQVASGKQTRALLPNSPRLGVWPASVLFFLFIWMELEWEGSEQPASLATAMLAYSALSWLGMIVYGRAVWLQHGEVFNVVFSLLARFAPNCWQQGQWSVRPYAVGLLSEKPLGMSHIVLVMLMLSSVSFDGVLETQSWLDLNQALVIALPASLVTHSKTLALLIFPTVFLLVFLACCRLIAWCGKSESLPPASTLQTAGLYVLSLVPISIAYHFAHYLSFLAMAVQYLIPLASDPFALGWDLFGTKLYFIRLGVVDARMVWYVSLFAIVAGHVAAVYLAHITSMRQFRNQESATRSQYPMLALMVAYTLLSLWIISQPIVTG